MLRHLRAILILPFMVTLVIPTVFIVSTRGQLCTTWDVSNAVYWLPIGIGAFFIASGIFLLGQTIRLFGLFGNGTLAP